MIYSRDFYEAALMSPPPSSGFATLARGFAQRRACGTSLSWRVSDVMTAWCIGVSETQKTEHSLNSAPESARRQ
ncbi:MAG: hypothetical protein K2M11_02225 [Paramuribaculum sp.]|nr:hypothetical protein [Paramuribaculum sp.]